MVIQDNSSPWISLFKAFTIVALTVAFTWLCVAESHQNGRLASSPNYDDCVYFYSGATLLDAVKREGWAGVGKTIAKMGLHSPFSTILAACSFALFGPSEASPYHGNLIVVLIYLSGIGWFLRRLPPLTWLFFLTLFLTPPFITMGVVEFRPDIAWAVTVGFGAVFIVTAEQIFRRPATGAFAGLLMALALLIKPSTFVMTGILFSGAACSRLIGAGLRGEWRTTSSRQVVIGVIAFIVTVLLISGPYAWRFGASTWNYFIENSFGINKDIWAYQGGFKDALLFYISGEGARSNLHVSGWIVSGTGIVSFIYLYRNQPGQRWKLLVLLGLIASAFVINTVAKMKSPFLGGGIYGVMYFGSAWAIAGASVHMASNLDARSRFRITGIRAVLLLLAVSFYHWPSYSNWGNDRTRCENYRAAHKHMQALLDQHRQKPPSGILFTQAGPIVMEATGLWFPFNERNVRLGSAAFFRTESEFAENYPKWDWVVIQEQGVMGSSENMPSEALLPGFLAIIRADPEFAVISDFTSANGRHVWIYAKRPGG